MAFVASSCIWRAAESSEEVVKLAHICITECGHKALQCRSRAQGLTAGGASHGLCIIINVVQSSVFSLIEDLIVLEAVLESSPAFSDMFFKGGKAFFEECDASFHDFLYASGAKMKFINLVQLIDPLYQHPNQIGPLDAVLLGEEFQQQADKVEPKFSADNVLPLFLLGLAPITAGRESGSEAMRALRALSKVGKCLTS
ncbi:hypothetical protein DFH07DRAFT_772809 [Mycena maculata]|uniref:Uncharacterized protein n=1 Tax=Mycena maculata TaxID=230809 RepID=A0AAD7NEC0_9AGAR|nr:hypothetical protein DFH07DRAFT_772809 [Mycena maculata]